MQPYIYIYREREREREREILYENEIVIPIWIEEEGGGVKGSKVC